MHTFSRVQINAQLEQWLQANRMVAQGQSYTIATEQGSRTLTRVNSREILEQIQFWQQQLNAYHRDWRRTLRRLILD